MSSGFVHLRVHSAYSLAEGAIGVKDLVKLCRKLHMPAVAITDTNNLFGALEFAVAATDAGIQPIIGCQLAIAHPDLPGDMATANLVLLVQTEAGYRNLIRLVSDAHRNSGAAAEPKLSLVQLEGSTEGLICLTGGPDGLVGQLLKGGNSDAARVCFQALQTLFGDRLYIELMRHGETTNRRVEAGLIDLAYSEDVPLVATNECFFADASMYEAHDALLCIASGSYLIEDNRRRVTPDHRFKTADEMAALFADLPEATANTLVIAKRCSFLLRPIQPILPRFTETESEAALLTRIAGEGLEERLAAYVFTPEMNTKAERDAIAQPYRDRLAFELTVIANMQFPGYFLIVADFIKWARGRGIPVGPGRGSGAGSVVAWALTITDLDPLRFGLLFERFLNPERVSMPDFDIDFCQDRRDEVINYVRERHGNDRVAQIITFGKLQARAVLRDVGRVMQMPYGQVDRICKMVPNNPAKPVTLAEAIAGEPALQAMREDDEQVGRLMDIALKLEGLYRHASTHAAGVVIGDRPLDQLVPLYRDPKSDMPVTQFSMKYVEQAGLVKFDFLGLTTLTIVKKAEDLIRAAGTEISIDRIPLDDAKTFELLTRAEAMGIFQLESSGMRDALRRLKPTRIEDVIALVALYRPGPMDNIPKYCRVKAGEEAASYPHESLKPILEETFGIMVYQEQVMQIAQSLAGYSLGSADLLRRAMGKKIKAEMEAQRRVFSDGAVANGIEPEQAGQIFDLVAKFADYGFNKSHAAAYALIAYQTAWLKANYPLEFIAASMTLAMSNTDKLAAFRQELMRQEIKLLPPDVNRSDVEFAVETQPDGSRAIRYALAAVKGVGAPAMEFLVAERRRNGTYVDLFDLAKRLDARVLNKRQIESLAHAGACDDLNANRAETVAMAEAILRHAAAAAERESGQANMFAAVAHPVPLQRPANITPYDPLERLKREFEAIGFYLSSHPLDAHERALQRLGTMRSSEIGRRTDTARIKLAGVVVARQERTSAKGNRFAFVQLSDVAGVYEVMVFSELLAQHRSLLEGGKLVLLSADVQNQNDEIRMTAQSFEPLETAVATVPSETHIAIDRTVTVDRLAALFENAKTAKAQTVLELHLDNDRVARIELPRGWRLTSAGRYNAETVSGVREVRDV